MTGSFYTRRVGHSKGVATEDINHVYIKFSKSYEDLTKKYLKLFNSCLRRDGITKTMKCLFGVQTVFTTASKHYKLAVNSFYKRLLVIT